MVKEFGDGSADDDLAERQGGEDLQKGVFGELVDRSGGNVHLTAAARPRGGGGEPDSVQKGPVFTGKIFIYLIFWLESNVILNFLGLECRGAGLVVQ